MTHTVAVRKTSTDTVFDGPVRVVGVYVVGSGTAGSVILKNDGTGGTALLTINTPATDGANFYLPVGGAGMLFADDCHATIANVTAVTVFAEVGI